MNQETSEISESLNLILNKLEAIDSKLEQQEEDIKSYIQQSHAGLDSNELLIAGLKSTRTSFELLRDEIDELHQVTIALFKSGERS